MRGFGPKDELMVCSRSAWVFWTWCRWLNWQSTIDSFEIIVQPQVFVKVFGEQSSERSWETSQKW